LPINQETRSYGLPTYKNRYTREADVAGVL